jgi:hypothetical protein
LCYSNQESWFCSHLFQAGIGCMLWLMWLLLFLAERSQIFNKGLQISFHLQ